MAYLVHAISVKFLVSTKQQLIGSVDILVGSLLECCNDICVEAEKSGAKEEISLSRFTCSMTVLLDISVRATVDSVEREKVRGYFMNL